MRERRGIVEGTFQIKKYEGKKEDGRKNSKRCLNRNLEGLIYIYIQERLELSVKQILDS